MKNLICIIPMLLFLSSCSHTIRLRANHFASPVVGDNQWSGHFALVGTSITKVTLVNDYTSNPPLRTNTEINKDLNTADVLFISNLGLDASLSLLKSLEIFAEGAFYGLRWQFLNHGSTTDAWVAAVQGGYGVISQSVSETSGGVTADANSKVQTTHAGASVGYKIRAMVPYLSYIRENHEVTTEVTHNAIKFGPFKDSGVHDYYSVGLKAQNQGFMVALEFSKVSIQWDRSDRVYQNAFGGKAGFAW